MTLSSVLLLAYLVSNPVVAEWLERNHVELVERNDLSPEAAAGAPANPGIVVGAFRARDQVNAALLRTNGDQVVFEIVACSDRGTCSVEVHQDVSRYSRIVFLEKVIKGVAIRTANTAETRRTVKLTMEAVKIHYFEKAAVVYFWNVNERKWDSIGVTD